MRGITDLIPAAFRRCTTRGAAELLAAVSDGLDGRVSTSGFVNPARRRSGRRYWLSATWSLVRSPATIPMRLLLVSRPELLPHCTTVARICAWSGPVHHK